MTEKKVGLGRRVLRTVNSKIDRWVRQEEYAAAEQQHREDRQAAIGEMKQKIEEIMGHMQEHMEQLNAEVEKIRAEDHSVAPTQDDIDRYFGYHSAFVENMKLIKEHTGVWLTEEKTLLDVTEYNAGAVEGGWKYLRESCGMPEGDLDNQPAPWKAEGHGQGWKTDAPAPETQTEA